MAGTDPIGEPYRERGLQRATAIWRDHTLSYLLEEVAGRIPITVRRIASHEVSNYRERVRPIRAPLRLW
jgi:hypothetical protein